MSRLAEAIEITEAALGTAERDPDVNAERIKALIVTLATLEALRDLLNGNE